MVDATKDNAPDVNKPSIESIEKFGSSWLVDLFNLFDEIRTSNCRQGRIEIIIQDGRIHKMGGMKWKK